MSDAPVRVCSIPQVAVLAERLTVQTCFDCSQLVEQVVEIVAVELLGVAMRMFGLLALMNLVVLAVPTTFRSRFEVFGQTEVQ